MGSCFSSINRSPPPNPSTSLPQNADAIDPNHDCVEQEKANEAIAKDGPSTMCTDENEEFVITSIRATDLAFGLRRIPAGFYAAVHHTGLEWKTENKSVSVSSDILEWSEPIPLPSDLSTSISLSILASFEFQPMLGNGEQVRKVTTTVDELLDRSERDLPFVFIPEDGDVLSPCSTLSVTLRRRKRTDIDTSASRVLNLGGSSTESRGQLDDSTNKGHSALSCYRKRREKHHLEFAIAQFEHALNICPVDHPGRAAAQSNLAMAKLIYYRVYDADASLDVLLALYHDTLGARPVGHPDRPSTLIHLATAHLAWFEKRGDHADAERAEALLLEAVELSSAESYENRAAKLLQLPAGRTTADSFHASGQSTSEQSSISSFTDMDTMIFSDQFGDRLNQIGDSELERAISALGASILSIPSEDCRHLTALNNLGAALTYRFSRLGEMDDLQEAISKQKRAVELTPDAHPDKANHLSNLGNYLSIRFEYFEDICDLEDAIRCQRGAVDLIHDDHPHKHVLLSNLGDFLITHFEHTRGISDLDEAISRQRDAVRIIPDNHPKKPSYLHDLGNSLKTRFERLKEMSDLEEGITSLRDAVRLTHDEQPDKPSRLNNLGSLLRFRFERLGDVSDLEEAIASQRAAVHLTPDDHPDKPSRLNNLCNSLRTRFKRFGGVSDLEEVISSQRAAVHLTPDGHPYKPSRLSNLGTFLLTRFEHFGDIMDLEEAISSQRSAVQITPDGHPDKTSRLNGLGSLLRARFERLGDISDLEEAISRQKIAVDLTPDGHPEKLSCLNNLCNSFRSRFKRFGDISDLEQAISMLREVFQKIPDGHPDKPACLYNLGSSLMVRFERLGERKDLEESILRLRDAVHMIPDGYLDKPSRLNALGNSFYTRFNHFGDISDLEQAISSQRDAVHITPDGHPDKSGYLSNLGNSFYTRFNNLDDIGDLEEAISRQQDAVRISPDDHPIKPALLNNLAGSLYTRFKRLGQLSDLNKGISRQRSAVHIAPDDHPDKLIYLSNFSNFFLTRFECFGNPNDIEEAISWQRDAIRVTSDNHPDKPACLYNLGKALRARFEHLGEERDVEESISNLRDAVRLTPGGHPDKPGRLRNLGDSFLARFEHLGEKSDLKEAVSQYSDAACASTGSIGIRFQASQQWIYCARRLRHHSILHAYTVAVHLLPQLAWIGLPLAHRYRALMQGVTVVREAAAAALEFGCPETSIEWLEQGRSVVWGELSQLRNPYDELLSAHPDHARRLRGLSTALEHAGATHEKLLSTQNRARESLQQEAERHRALANERDKLLQEIRRLPSFERFLLHKEFSELRASAYSGPVVFLNAADTRCDALIVLADVECAIHVPLTNFTPGKTKSFQTSLQSLVRHTRDGRYGYPVSQDGGKWKPILASLWKCVVKPVLDALAFSTPGDRSRIFWCPTGPFTFFPIHAAGFYDTFHSQPGHKVYDYVVSSYVPTLSILTSSAQSETESPRNIHLLAVRQPPSDGKTPLPGVTTELDYIRTVTESCPSTTLREPCAGTVEEILSLMKDADWVHFACHGVQDASHPAESGLCLAQGCRLKISDMIALSRPRERGGLAFLSACQTAMGDEDLADEAIHIAAGMLFAGYSGVVGTMWSIRDVVAPEVARDVYEQLFRQDGKKPDEREAALALQEAVGRLRDREVPFDDWLPFIHVGL